MFDWLRKLVAGPKNRTITEGYDLDLTYITSKIIAMAFPASGPEKLFRNCIEDVARFLQERHKGKYYVINVSNREYDTNLFEGRVKSYEWNDHQAPCLTTLFEMTQFSSKFLRQKQQNVVIFHCNHGKGRTGTAIMGLLMYMQSFENEKDVLDFYNQKRFTTSKYACSQPCQIRYLHFFDKIMKNQSKFQIIRTYKLSNIKYEGLNDNYYLKITCLRKNRTVYTKVKLDKLESVPEDQFLMGDIFIQIFKQGFLMDLRVCRINFHMQFAQQIDDNKCLARFQGQNLSLQKCQGANFMLELQFDQYCECHIKEKWSPKCICFKEREKQEWHWSKMHHVIRNRPRKDSYCTFDNNTSEQHIGL